LLTSSDCIMKLRADMRAVEDVGKRKQKQKAKAKSQLNTQTSGLDDDVSPERLDPQRLHPSAS